jgi:hypothetical protein
MDRRGFLRSLGLVGLTAGITYGLARRTHFSGGYYVQMGTSVTSGGGISHSGGTTKFGHIAPVVVGDRLGMPALNVGFPGSCAGEHKFPKLNPTSLYCLVDSIIANDWSLQIASIDDQTRQTSLSRLMTAGFPTVTHLGLEYGTNDFHYDRPIGADRLFKRDIQGSAKLLDTKAAHDLPAIARVSYHSRVDAKSRRPR